MSNINTQQENNGNVILTSREFFRKPARITEMTRSGQNITVTNRGEHLFDVIGKKQQPLTGKRVQEIFGHLVIKGSGDTDLSQRVDGLVYGN